MFSENVQNLLLYIVGAFCYNSFANRHIIICISEYIKDNESIDVRGRSIDKDGVESGYNYDEFYIKSIKNTSFKENKVFSMFESINSKGKHLDTIDINGAEKADESFCLIKSSSVHFSECRLSYPNL